MGGFILFGFYLVSVESPGAGNMNFTARVVTNDRSFILKQSREYVEKYPTVDAPATRVLIESKFYETIKNTPSVRNMMPILIHVDPINFVIMLSDLGSSADFMFCYKEGESIQRGNLNEIVEFAAFLHSIETTDVVINNDEMKQLNHEHIFVFPFQTDSKIDLDKFVPGLNEVAKTYRNDAKLKEQLQKLGERYLATGDYLLHGDYYPGSWLRTASGIKVIDVEFCFLGDREFDVGVLIAHLLLSQHPQELVEYSINLYNEKSKIPLNNELVWKFAGVEILRRILGLAQLPLCLPLSSLADLMNTSYCFIMNSNGV